MVTAFYHLMSGIRVRTLSLHSERFAGLSINWVHILLAFTMTVIQCNINSKDRNIPLNVLQDISMYEKQ